MRHSKNRPGHNGAATANPALWKPYLDVIREKCSLALHIFDRFHIVAKMNKALDEVRAGESRKMGLNLVPHEMLGSLELYRTPHSECELILGRRLSEGQAEPGGDQEIVALAALDRVAEKAIACSDKIGRASCRERV